MKKVTTSDVLAYIHQQKSALFQAAAACVPTSFRPGARMNQRAERNNKLLSSRETRKTQRSQPAPNWARQQPIVDRLLAETEVRIHQQDACRTHETTLHLRAALAARRAETQFFKDEMLLP
ncbi:hypothetical protein FGG78_11105 [Thioclava sp. BHET1]|nr:hypothetical protein FGG78_11105 [Thioclava sp. BHET1]